MTHLRRLPATLLAATLLAATRRLGRRSAALGWFGHR